MGKGGIIAPYGYQEETNSKILKAIGQGIKAGFIYLASGLGKTVTAAFLAKRLLAQLPSLKVLYLCNQTHVLTDRQAPEKFQAVIGGDSSRFGQYHGSRKDRHAQFLFASFQTMDAWRRNFRRDEFDLVIVDESHHAPAETYLPTVRYFRPRLFLLGMTATPKRADTRDMGKVFANNELYTLPLEEAIPRGLLTPVEYQIISDEIVKLGKVEAREIGSGKLRISMKQLNRRLFAPLRDEEIVRIIGEKIKNIRNPKVMIFCPSIDHAERLHQLIPYSLPVHSRMARKKQEERIRLFRDGLAHTVITVDKFNEGVDIPEVNVVVFLRSTQSHVIFSQQLGRGLRLHEGKKKVLVLDFVANCERVEMLHRLVTAVQKPYVQVGQRKQRVVHFSCNFTHAARNVLDILERIRGGYTPELLTKQLKAEAKRLGRTPLKDDISKSSKKGRTASHLTFTRIFGSWNKALKAAKLKVNQYRYTKVKLIKQLKAEARRLGQTPSVDRIDKSSRERRTASSATFINTFGSWNKALKAAGLKVNLKRG